MPQGIFKSVYSVSSEDAAHPAKNLLRIESGKKWKTKTQGEKSAFVILQLDKPEKITGIDLGNEHSAFIEVLVGRPAFVQDDFKEILITCSYMTPVESKNSTNFNRVRCFKNDSLVATIAEEKWDLVKIVCTQPFNRHVQYGLSLVKIHVAGTNSNDETNHHVPLQVLPKTSSSDQDRKKFLGKFKLREDSPDSDSETSSGLFSRWKQSTNLHNESTAATIRAASNPSSLKAQNDSLKPTIIINPHDRSSKRRNDNEMILDRDRDDILFDADDDEKLDKRNEILERRISEDQERVKWEREKHTNSIKKQKQKIDTKPVDLNGKKDFHRKTDDKKTHKNSSETKTNHKNSSETKKNDKIDKKREKSPISNAKKKLKLDENITYRPFNQLLNDVALVISGIQNPERGIIRQKAIQMGAKYKPDWDRSSTHLICAFKNTPKYLQVKGKGKIISKDWIEKCYTTRKRLPWRRFALDGAEINKPESEDEIYDISLKPKSPSPLKHRSISPSKQTCRSPISSKKNQDEPRPSTSKGFSRTSSSSPSFQKQDSSELYDSNENNPNLESGSDTEDEIEKIKNTKQQNVKDSCDGDVDPSPPRKQTNDIENNNIYEVSTEEEDIPDFIRNKVINKKFFETKKFFINPKISSSENKKLTNLINQYGGKIFDDITNVDYAITNERIRLPSEFIGKMVEPEWIYECHEIDCCMPINSYMILDICTKEF